MKKAAWLVNSDADSAKRSKIERFRRSAGFGRCPTVSERVETRLRPSTPTPRALYNALNNTAGAATILCLHPNPRTRNQRRLSCSQGFVPGLLVFLLWTLATAIVLLRRSWAARDLQLAYRRLQQTSASRPVEPEQATDADPEKAASDSRTHG